MATIPEGYRRLEGSERRIAQRAQRVGAADPNETIKVTIRVRRRAGAPTPPDQDHWAMHPPGKRQFITREELAAQCGAAPQDLDKVASFARSQGLQVTVSDSPRRSVVVTGTVAQANSAFAVDLGHYQSDEQSYRGREGFIYLPADVADVVVGVFGLDNRRVAKPANVPALLTTAQITSLYHFPPGVPLPSGANASGQTIGLMEFGTGGFAQSDVNQFFATLAIPAPGSTDPGAGQLTVLSVDGTTNSPGTASSPNPIDGEVTLDIEVAGSVASGANIAVYFAPNSEEGGLDAYNEVIYGDIAYPCALSISYGASESEHTSDFMTAADGFFQEMAWLGITVFAGTGDSGSNAAVNDGAAHVPFPASDPWVVACGGTQIAIKPSFSEETWNSPGTPFSGPGATGGGVSAVWPVPKWQSGLQSTLSGGSSAPLTGRGVPDVSGFADLGYPIVRYGVVSNTGGTSAVGPLYAGLIALYTAYTGERMGYINPMLYAIAARTGQTALVDVSIGNNELTSSTTVPCPSYVATVGWDACTGLGHIDGTALLAALMPLEEVRPVDPDHPFPFGVGGEWLNYHNQGASDSGNSVNAGQINNGAPNDTTLINTPCNNSATLAGDNMATLNGVVGVFGRSRGATWSMGVAGESQTGCGVFGLATGENPASRNVVGVAGRSMAGFALEADPLERLVESPIGVLGQCMTGPGVRGHGGPLLKQQPGATLAAFKAAPGGVFSSGRLEDRALNTDPAQTVGIDPAPQLRLVPSVAPTLPLAAQVGDLYVMIPGQGNTFVNAQLYICTSLSPPASGAVPQWQQVQLGPVLPGGSSV
jgi:kumamolisin